MKLQIEFRWLKRTLEVPGQINPALQTRTIASGTGDVYGPWENASPWVDVPLVTEEQAQATKEGEAAAGVFEDIPAERREEDEYAFRVALVMGACVVAVILFLLVKEFFAR